MRSESPYFLFKPERRKNLLLAGSHSIVATYAGDTNDTGSASAPYSLTVTQESITLSSSPNPSIYGSPVSFTVTVPAVT